MGSARLSILPLRTLVGMFHDQDATDRRDKIFALLGMSSEDSLEIKVDYKTTWKLLFRDLIHSIVGQKPDILTWEGSEMALIQGYGCVLGKVTEITPATAINQYDTICVTSKHFRGHGGQVVEWHASLTIPAMVKPILVGDVVCLLEGSLYPTIIRLCNDGNSFRAFLSVISLSVPTPERVFIASPYSASITWSDLLVCISSFNRTFVLSWHWGFEGALQDWRQWRRDRIPTTHPDLNADPFNQIPKERYDFVRLGDIALVYDDLEDLHTLRKVLQGMSTITTGTMNGPSEIQSFLQLLDHWQVYNRLKRELELVYWELWKIHSRRQWQTTFEDLISLYAEEGNMQYGLFEVAKLMSDYTFTLPSRTISPLSHKSRSVSTQLSGMLHDKLSSHDWASFPWDIQREQDMTGPGPLRAMLKKFLQNVKLPQRILLKRSRELNIKQHSGPASLFPSSIAETLKSEDPIAYAQLNVVEKHSNNVHRLLVLLKPKNTTDTNTIYLALRAIAGEFQINGGWLGLQSFDVLKLLFGDPPVNDAITNESFAHFTHLAHQYNDDCVVKFLHQWYCPLSLISA
ncbi:hypothetical protein BKA66DRAFT_572179 [Pyrenochaeta sp. MPI-SDFR-AT-0127]|nr:hypothetical protein BKA66DRAFT_572179 [Pyrenochaeta sp. MPI-SDFR-AT-0127]